MNRIRDRREELGMKQADLLAIIREVEPRIDIGTLSRIENGYVLPASEEVMTALERGLQAPRGDLFDSMTVFAVENAKAPRAAITDRVASVLDYGKDYAVSREELAGRLGTSDRGMRRMLEEARMDGLAVCCDQDGKGYYLADTPEEYRRQYYQARSRAMKLLVQCSRLKEGMA